MTFRDLPGLQATARSVLAQTDPAYEWIVIDGGSGNGTAQWLAEQTSPNIRWLSEPDKGTYDAMNKGLDRCRADYVVFLNGGDTFASERTLETVRHAIEGSPEAPDIIYGDSIDMDSDRELYKRARRPGHLRFGMYASHQSMYFRRAHCPGLRYDLRFPVSADYAFIAAFTKGRPHAGLARHLYVPHALCRFSMGGTHFVRRRKGIQEDYLIRREILDQPLALAAVLRTLHHLHHTVKLTLPSLSRALRYRFTAAPR